jgi:MFS family permease
MNEHPRPPGPEGARPPRRLLRAFRHRNYRLYFLGQGISLIGTWMQGLAQSWLIYRLTGSSLALGGVNFAGQLPVLVLAPLGGVLADRLDRRRLLVLTQAASILPALVLAALTLAGAVEPWHVFALAALLGAVNAIDIPARQAFVMELVGREDLANAIGLNSSMFNGARVVGPALAGLLVGAAGEGVCFLLNAASFLAVLVCLARMDTPPSPAGGSGSALTHIREAISFAAGEPEVRGVLVLLGAVSLVGMSFLVLMPVFADQILDSGPEGLGVLMSASGLGAFIGALTLASRRDQQGLLRWIFAAAAGFGVCVTAFALSRSFWLSAGLLVPGGFCMIMQMAATNTFLQLTSPDRLRGRVMALYAMLFIGFAPFGALLAGSLAHGLGAPAAAALGGLASLGAALVLRRRHARAERA